MYYGDGRNKTQAAREWSYRIMHQLSLPQNQEQLEKIRASFDRNKHCFQLSMRALYPKNILYKKDGTISAKSMDLTNWEKPLVDLLFLPKYFDVPSPYGCKNINCDDKYVTSMYSTKAVSESGTHKIEITVKIRNLRP